MAQLQELTDQSKRSVFSTGLILVLANLLPIIAVTKLGWTVYDLLILYWLEIILIGVINVLKMIMLLQRNSKPTASISPCMWSASI